MLDPPSLDAIVELLSIFLMPPIFLNHFTLLDLWKYFTFTGSNDLLGFVGIEGVLSLVRIKDLLSFVRIKDLPGFTFLESRIS
nr:hypothetical protein CFP56_62342 [Quercus suber]